MPSNGTATSTRSPFISRKAAEVYWFVESLCMIPVRDSAIQVLANFGFLISLLGGHIVQRIFFGPLRANEVEVRFKPNCHPIRCTERIPQRLYDRLWFFITESLLAFTIFRDEFDAPFVVMFGFLLFVKSFHWLVSDRIEWVCPLTR